MSCALGSRPPPKRMDLFTLMDLAHDQEKLDLIEFLMSLGLYTDYIFIEEDMK